MRSPLLCELHAHTTFSDGSLTVRELVDLYGFAGFDVLAVTDHACRDAGARALTAAAHAGYLACLESEAETRQEALRPARDPGPRADVRRRRPAPGRACARRRPAQLDLGRRRARRLGPRRRARRCRADRRAPVHARGGGGLTPRDGAVRRGTRVVSRGLPPLRALQPPRALPLGSRRAAAGGGERRLPPPRASGDVEDAAALRSASEEAVVSYLRSGREVGLVRFDPGLSPAQLAVSAA